MPQIPKNWREKQAEGIEVAKSQAAYEGRKLGSTKAQIEQAIKLRSRGLSIEEIAKKLRVSTRTVTRYLKTIRSVSAIDAALFQLPTVAYVKLFTAKANSKLDAMQLFLLKRLKHPNGRKFWNEASHPTRCDAKDIERLFDSFLGQCSQVSFRNVDDEPDDSFES